MDDLQTIKEFYSQKLFDDNYQNVVVLLTTLENAYREGIIEQSKELTTLMEIKSALVSTKKDVVRVLEKHKNNNYGEQLYDLYKHAQAQCFKGICNECYNFNSDDLDETLQTDNVPVYNIKKLPKKMLINVAKLERNAELSKEELQKFLEQYVYYRNYRKIEGDYKSLSFVSNNDIHAFRDINQFVTFVYPNDIPERYVITIAKKDAHVKFYKKFPASRMRRHFTTPKNLLDSTNEFNEIAVLRKDGHNPESREVLPVAILCNKKITPLERKIANMLDISIIFSETEHIQKKYSKKKKLDYKYYTPGKKEVKYDFTEIVCEQV